MSSHLHLWLFALAVALFCCGDLVSAQGKTIVLFHSSFDPLLQDAGFYQSADDGFKRIKADFPTATVVYRQFNYDDVVARGAEVFPPEFSTADMIVTLGFEFYDACQAWAKNFTKINFVFIDDVLPIELPNLVCAIFREDEAGYVAGAGAGLISRSRNIGLFGGYEVPAVRRYMNGFIAGAAVTCPTCKVHIGFTYSWDDVNIGLNVANDLISAGSDIIFPVAGAAGNLAMVQTPIDNDTLTIGVDTDAYLTLFGNNASAPGAKNLMFSVGKSIDSAVAATVGQFLKTNQLQTGLRVLALSNGGIRIFPCYSQCNTFDPNKDEQVLSIRDQLKNGELSTGFDTLTGLPLTLTRADLQNKWQQFKPAWRPTAAIDVLAAPILVDSVAGTYEILLATPSGLAGESWIFTPSLLSYYPLLNGGNAVPRVSKGAMASYLDTAYLFGGADPDSAAANSDLWKFTYATRSWEKQTPTGTWPSPRQMHSGVMWKDWFVIFGGEDIGFLMLNELWAYNITSSTWQQLPSATDAREHHSAVVIGDAMYVYGGQDKSFKVLGSIAVFDFNSKTWLNPNRTDVAPPPRRYHTAVALGTTMLILGGVDATNDNKPQSVIRIDFNQAIPKLREKSTLPYGLSLAGSALVVQGGQNDAQIWTFGGSNENGTRQSVMLYMSFNLTTDAISYNTFRFRYVSWRSGAAVVLSILAAVGIAAAIAVAVVSTLKMRSPVIQFTTLPFIYATCLGLILLFGSIYTFPGTLGVNVKAPLITSQRFQSSSCMVRLWLIGMGAVLLIAPMLAKSFRLFQILENTTLLQTKIEMKELLLYAGIPITLEAILLIIWSGVARFRSVGKSTSSTEATVMCYCKHFWPFMGIQLAFFAILLVFGMFVALKTYKIGSKVLLGESRYIGYGYFIISIALIALALIQKFLQKFYVAYFVIATLVILFASLLVMVLVYAVKMYVLFFRSWEKQSQQTSASEFSTNFKPDDDFQNN